MNSGALHETEIPGELTAVLSVLGSGIVLADREARVHFANGAARRILGCRRNEEPGARDFERHGIVLRDLVNAALSPGRASIDRRASGIPGSLPVSLRAIPLPGAETSGRVAIIIEAARSPSGWENDARELWRDIIPALRGAERAITLMVEETGPAAGGQERESLLTARTSLLRATVLAHRIAGVRPVDRVAGPSRSHWWWWGEIASAIDREAAVDVSAQAPRVHADRALLEAAVLELVAAWREATGGRSPGVTITGGTGLPPDKAAMSSTPAGVMAPLIVFGTPLASAELRIGDATPATTTAPAPRTSLDSARLDLVREVAELHAGSLDIDSSHGEAPVYRLVFPAEPRAIEALMAELSLERMLDEASRKRFPVTLGLVDGLDTTTGEWEQDDVSDAMIARVVTALEACTRREDGPPFRAPGGLVGVILADADEGEAEAVWSRLGERWATWVPTTGGGRPSLRLGTAQFPGARSAVELFKRAKTSLLDHPKRLG